MAQLRITRASHFYKVEPLVTDAKAICYEFVRRFLKIDVQGNHQTVVVFAASNKDRTWFRFHINSYSDFKQFVRMRNIEESDMEFVDMPLPVPPAIKLEMQDKWEIREDQEPVIEYLTKPVGAKDETGFYPPGVGGHARLVGLATGSGKTVCAIKAISEWKYRCITVVKPKYIQKWVGDYCGALKIKPEEILTVSGGSEMQALTQLAVTRGGLDKYKVIIISNRTFANYIKAYEMFGDSFDAIGYLVAPEDLWAKCNAGIRLIDEVHEDFHFNFRLDLYTNIALSISLSATLISRDAVLMRMYEIAYPAAERYAAPPPGKYTDSYGVTYATLPNYRLKTSNRGQSSYNHNQYEDSILKYKGLTEGYFSMIKRFLNMGFVKHYEEGHKAIVFASSIAMCTAMTEYLQEQYPQYNVKRFVGGDDYQKNYQEPTIRVTTIGSGGTGHDIKGLTDAHLTHNIDSIQANIQAFGRLRKIPDKPTRFFFYTNSQIPKHVSYHKKKKELMRERAQSFTELYHGDI